jgi:hypothetical protein
MEQSSRVRFHRHSSVENEIEQIEKREQKRYILEKMAGELEKLLHISLTPEMKKSSARR